MFIEHTYVQIERLLKIELCVSLSLSLSPTRIYRVSLSSPLNLRFFPSTRFPYLLLHVIFYNIHHMLKNSRSVCETKWHYHVLKMLVPGSKCRFPFISSFDTHQVVSASEIDFGVRGLEVVDSGFEQ